MKRRGPEIPVPTDAVARVVRDMQVDTLNLTERLEGLILDARLGLAVAVGMTAIRVRFDSPADMAQFGSLLIRSAIDYEQRAKRDPSLAPFTDQKVQGNA